MASSANNMSLQLLLLCAWCLTGNHMKAMARTLPSMKQDAQLESQTNRSNKPILRTISTIHGEKYDCVDFYKQPAFDHPALKNHNFHPEMKARLDFETRRNTYSSHVNQDFGYMWKNGKGCPLGSVPIKRTIKDDLIRVKLATEIYATNYEPLTAREVGTHYAILRTNDGTTKKFNGAGMFTSVFPLSLSGTQYSSSYLKIINGQDSIEVGWTVNPTLYNDTQTRSFIYTNTATTQCFNSYCPGFVSVRSDIPLDQSLAPLSIRGSENIYGKFILIYRDPATNNWWLEYGHNQTQIGFWPHQIFTGLSNMATYVEWGGKVYGPPSEPSPPMGAGEELMGDTSFDAICSLITTINESHDIVDAKDASAYADIKQYRVIDKGFFGPDARRAILFGGHGGYNGN